MTTLTRLTCVLAIAAAAPRLGAQNPTPPASPGAPASDAAPSALREAAAVDSGGKKLTGYYAIPEIPATTLLGIAPASINRPATPKDFASSIIDGVGADGRVRQGLALEASAGLLPQFRVPLSVYQSDARARFWSNLLVSLATARPSGDTASTDLAWGIRAPLIDEGDPLASRKFTALLGKALLDCAPVAPPDFIPANPGRIPGETQAQAQARVEAEYARIKPLVDALNRAQIGCLERASEEIGKQAADELWNARRLFVAYAGSMRLGDSRFANHARTADRVWVTGAIPLSDIAGPMPFAKSTQLVAYVDFTHRRALDTLIAYSAVSYGGRLNFGGANVNLFYELLGEARNHPPAGVPTHSSGWSGGVEFLAAEGTWISTGVGKRASEILKPDRTVLLASIRWGISSKSFLKPSGP
jgi:hypothetical protein